MGQHSVENGSTYDRLSRWYDGFAGSEGTFIRQALRELAPRPGERVLEIGCGTGRALVEIAEIAGGPCQVLGIDRSAGMLRQAKAHLRQGARHFAHLCRADALALPYASAVCDAALMTFTLELFSRESAGRVLQECRRVLRRGGRLGVAALLQTVPPGLMERLYGWFHRRYPRWIDCQPIRVADVLSEVGFQVVSLQRGKMWGLPVAVVLARKE